MATAGVPRRSNRALTAALRRAQSDMAAYDGYAARASRGYAAREGLYSAKGYKAEKPKEEGWRLSDRLYELSLDAEAREARQKRSERPPPCIALLHRRRPAGSGARTGTNRP